MRLILDLPPLLLLWISIITIIFLIQGWTDANLTIWILLKLQCQVT